MKYIAKPNTWFVAGQECILEIDCGNMGAIFYGLRETHREDCLCSKRTVNPSCQQRFFDRELCQYEEFNIIEGKPITHRELKYA